MEFFFVFFIGNCNSYFMLQRNPPINIIIFCKLLLMKEIKGPLENSSWGYVHVNLDVFETAYNNFVNLWSIQN